ncbi:MAG: BrnA antitoxin family protein [Chloroflexota bacterium]
MLKNLPDFKNEDEERAFWASNSSDDYLEWDNAQFVFFPNLKPTTHTISLRLPQTMLNEIKTLANQRDMPYQSLIKQFLRERIDQER